MKTKAFLSRIALILALLLAVSAFAACDLGKNSKEEKESKSAIKTYIYDSEYIPDYVEDFDEDAWTSSSKYPLCNGVIFEPGTYKLYVGKIENTTKKPVFIYPYFNVKGDPNPIADEITFTAYLYDENENIIVQSVAQGLSNYLNNDGHNFFSQILYPGECYYIALAFQMDTSVSGAYDAYDIGAEIYLQCNYEKISGEVAPIQTTGTVQGFDSEYNTSNEGSDYYESNIFSDSYLDTSEYIEDTSSSTDVAQVISSMSLYHGNIGLSWQSSIHDNNYTEIMYLNIYANGYLSLDFNISSESGCDQFKIYVNNYLFNTYSGEYSQVNFSTDVYVGDVITLEYSKDGSVSYGDDMVNVYDISLYDSAYNESGSDMGGSESGTEPESESFPYETFEYDLEYNEQVVVNPGDYLYAEYYNSDTNKIDKVWISSNHDADSSSGMSFHFTQTGYFTYSARVSSESGCDYFSVMLNNFWIDSYTGEKNEWGDLKRIEVYPGDTIYFVYSKDGSQSNGFDCGFVLNPTFILAPERYESDEYYVEGTSPLDECISFDYSEFKTDVAAERYSIDTLYDVFYPTNHGPSSSSSMSMTALQMGYLYFEALPICESGRDCLRVYVNGAQVDYVDGDPGRYSLHSILVREGDSIVFEYSKDSVVNSGDDTVYLRNFAFVVDNSYGGLFGFDQVFDFTNYIDGDSETWVSCAENGGSSVLVFVPKEDGVITFTYNVHPFNNTNYFMAIINGEAHIISQGTYSDVNGYLTVKAGDTVAFRYDKDAFDSGDDCVVIKDLTFTPN